MSYFISKQEYFMYKLLAVNKWKDAINLKPLEVVQWWNSEGKIACGFCDLTYNLNNLKNPKCSLCPFNVINAITEFSNGIHRVRCSEYFCKIQQLLEYNCPKFSPKKYRHFIALAKELLSQIESISYESYIDYLNTSNSTSEGYKWTQLITAN